MKPYTLWKMDDSKWVLEVEDEKLGDYLKEVVAKDGKGAKLERLGVGINTPLRVFTVEDENVISVEKTIEQWLRRK